MAEQLAQADSNNNSTEMYKLVRYLSGKFYKSSVTLVKKTDGTFPKDRQELNKAWTEYYNKLLNCEPVKEHDPLNQPNQILPIHTGEFTIEEIRQACKYMKNNKAPGIDNEITNETAKYGGEACLETIKEICNRVYNEGKPPLQLTTSIIISIPKKPNSNEMNNYRGISLMNTITKIFNKVILNRIRNHIDPLLEQNQKVSGKMLIPLNKLTQ